MSDWITRPVAELHITPESIVFTGTVSGPHKGTAPMTAEPDTRETPLRAFADRSFACSYSGGYYSVPEEDWDAVFAELDRRADALRDIRKAITATKEGREHYPLDRIGSILDAAGY